MSPGEIVRETAIRLLADEDSGLNPTFMANCQLRGIPVPLPGSGQGVPFDFSAGSASLFRMQEDISWLEHNSEQQYPCLVASARSAEQFRENRPMGALFYGEVIVDMQFYLAWSINELPAGDNFETHLDALEMSLLQVLNSATWRWAPVLYANLLDFPSRLPLATTNNAQLLRRGIRAQISAIVFIPQS